MQGKRTIIVIRNRSGEFFKSGGDAPDTWTTDPLDADDRSGYVTKRDAFFGSSATFIDCELVEFEVIATPTGRAGDALCDHDGKLLWRQEANSGEADS